MAKKKSGIAIPDDYAEVFESLKERVRRSQTKAMLSVNRELISLYWEIGRQIADRQERDGWGKSIVDRLARDLRAAFPAVKGFSPGNVWRMRAFYLAYQADQTNLAQPARELLYDESSSVSAAYSELAQAARELPPEPMSLIPWFHNVVIVEKVKDAVQRYWYAAKTLEHGWSRAILTVQIESGLYQREGGAVSNFATSLPSPQSDLAQQSLKDPYLFDFLTLHEDAVERDLENGLMEHIQKFLLELGAGFAFVGRQVNLVVGDDDFFLDLLFYHLKLRCFFVIDLKMRAFTPEDAGKMNFYLSTVDAQMRHSDDAPSIGLILCKTQNRVVAEYALRDVAKPIGVAEWQTKLVDSLPPSLKGTLPSIEEIEAEFESEDSP
ncbi:PDDEXK nuclease domain-containing protein [Gimesia maris]|uniref:PDDEXK nuclease domain-containing protein n=1 Tax=Gimesia maris TaxID=122 RepID=UPI003A8F1E1F